MPIPEPTIWRRRLLVGLLALATATFVGWFGLYYTFSLPITVQKSLESEPWQHSNVQLMRFDSADDFLGAERHLKRELLADNTPIPHYLLGELYQAQGRTPLAEHHYRTALKIASRTWHNQHLYQHVVRESRTGLATIYYDNNNYKAALAELEKTSHLNRAEDASLFIAMKDSLEHPDRADFHLVLGKRLRYALKLDKARQELNKAITLSHNPQVRLEAQNFLKTQMPRHIRALSPMARYYSLAAEQHQFESDDLWKAVRFYEKSIDETANFEWSYHELALIYRELKDYAKAGEYARNALALNPELYNAYLALGDIALDSENYRQAIGHFNRAREIINKLPETDSQELLANIENQIGYAYESLHDLVNAVHHYHRAMQAAADSMEDETASDYEYAQEALTRLSESRSKAKGSPKV